MHFAARVGCRERAAEATAGDKGETGRQARGIRDGGADRFKENIKQLTIIGYVL